MKMYREQILVETLIKYRFRKYGFQKIKVECFNQYNGDSTKCRVEVFKDGKRLMKHEAELNEKFVIDAENRLSTIMVEKEI
ncbi:hypothetical protein [Maribacter stanieri]|uniref:Uncharacterized protein n=1 Tax=Maribacter stanieri TaxID=440514 RepID=A0A1I6IEH9_9FLAO|nr:hypothetical protein [Maribacter stanieri]SFR65187.1 hypothetical protein SAMN04488010_1581 [Maribacter stanieri]